MPKSNTARRPFVQVTALWGNDDAESVIELSRKRWSQILAGASYTTCAWSWYEGERYRVTWVFTDGKLTIGGEDGMRCVLDQPASELIAHVVGGAE